MFKLRVTSIFLPCSVSAVHFPFPIFRSDSLKQMSSVSFIKLHLKCIQNVRLLHSMVSFIWFSSNRIVPFRSIVRIQVTWIWLYVLLLHVLKHVAVQLSPFMFRIGGYEKERDGYTEAHFDWKKEKLENVKQKGSTIRVIRVPIGMQWDTYIYPF